MQQSTFHSFSRPNTFTNHIGTGTRTRGVPRMGGSNSEPPMKRTRTMAAPPGSFAGVDIPMLLLADSYKATHPYMVSLSPCRPHHATKPMTSSCLEVHSAVE